ESLPKTLSISWSHYRLNIRAEHSNHKGVCYYNLFKNISSYEKDNGKNPYDAKIKSELRVNQYLLNLLGANYD
ncbi:hypothetical protein ACT7IB_004616, partial [Escherichia coli]